MLLVGRHRATFLNRPPGPSEIQVSADLDRHAVWQRGQAVEVQVSATYDLVGCEIFANKPAKTADQGFGHRVG